jgi:hypothetical protein
MTDTSRALPTALDARAVVLVEGVSDQLALEAVAGLLGRDLRADGVEVVPVGGATNLRRYLAAYGPGGFDVTVAGLCDAGEEPTLRRALESAGLGADLTSADMESLGFFVCDRDLEDELIRALGTATVEAVIAEHGELASLRTLQQQPAQRGWSTERQLRRFMGTRSGRKARYARLLAEALDPPRVPGPLACVLAHV